MLQVDFVTAVAGSGAAPVKPGLAALAALFPMTGCQQRSRPLCGAWASAGFNIGSERKVSQLASSYPQATARVRKRSITANSWTPSPELRRFRNDLRNVLARPSRLSLTRRRTNSASVEPGRPSKRRLCFPAPYGWQVDSAKAIAGCGEGGVFVVRAERHFDEEFPHDDNGYFLESQANTTTMTSSPSREIGVQKRVSKRNRSQGDRQ